MKSDINAKKNALTGENPSAAPAVEAGPRRRVGGRSARVLEAVANAVLREMEETGIENLSIPRIADRAGVSSSSIYRRWPTKSALIAFAGGHFAAEAIPFPERGSLRDELVCVLSEVHSLLLDPRSRGLAALTFSGNDSPEVVDAQRSYWKSRVDHQQAMFERAIQRGEIDEDTDTGALLERAIGPLYFRYFFTRAPITTEFLEGLADWALLPPAGAVKPAAGRGRRAKTNDKP